MLGMMEKCILKIAQVLNTSVEYLTLGKDEKIKSDNSEIIHLLETAIDKLK